MADKNFKVKSGLQVPSLTTAGPVTTDSAGNVTSSATLPITQGGTGQTTAGNALNALLPLQTSQDNKFLQTNGVSTQWTIPQQQTSTDGTVGYKIYSGTVTPSSPVTGDIWIDQTTGNGIQLVRWRKTIAATTTTLSALDDNNLTLSYTAGNEQVYINGTLITRGQDYTATNGTSVVLVQAAEIGDTVEIFGNPLFSVTDVYTQAQANSLYVSKSEHNAVGKNKIINSDFSVNQYGFTSITGVAGGTILDRWQAIGYQGGGTYTYSLQSFAPSEIITNGPVPAKKFMRIATSGTTTQDNRVLIAQKIEGVDCFAGQTVTVSFWAKALSGSPSIAVSALQGFGTNGSASVNNPLGKIQISTSWNRYSITGSIQSILNKTIGLNDFLRLELYVSAGTDWSTQASSLGFQNNTFDIWGIQIESGSLSTAYMTNTANQQQELAACQRYYYTLPYNYNAERANPYTDFLIMNTADQTSWARGVVQFPVTMRTSPTLQAPTAANYYILGSAGVLSVTSISIDNMTNASMAVVNAYRTGMSTGTTYFLRFAGNVTDYLRFSAEL